MVDLLAEAHDPPPGPFPSRLGPVLCRVLQAHDQLTPEVMSERLGHANITTTLTTYQHVLPGMDDEAAEAIARVVSASRESVEF